MTMVKSGITHEELKDLNETMLLLDLDMGDRDDVETAHRSLLSLAETAGKLLSRPHENFGAVIKEFDQMEYY